MTEAPPVAPTGSDVDVPARAPRLLGALLRFDRKVQKVEVALCAASLLLMIGLAFAQVLLRSFRTETLQPVAWFDAIARHMVIWVGMLGASLCTAEGRHISIEALPKLFGPGGRRKNDFLMSLASLAMVAVLFTLAMIYMLRVQVPDPAALFHIDALKLDVHRWPLLVIVPLGLGVIGWRFGLRAAQAWWMTDEEFKAREEAAEREVAQADAAQEEDEAAQLVAHEAHAARVSGRAPTLTPEAAREEVRRALHSDRPPAALPPTDVAAAAAGLATPVTPPAPATPPRTTPPARPGPGRSPDAPGRSTDEIPIYREIADDDDRTEPTGRHGDAVAESTEGDAVAESADGLEPTRAALDSEILEPPSDLGAADMSEDAVERLADTERLKIRPKPEPDEVQETDRLPRPDMPSDETGETGRGA